MIMEAARTSETSVDNYFTRQYIPEDISELHDQQMASGLLLPPQRVAVALQEDRSWRLLCLTN
jgi:hypothetical protein